MEVTFLLSQYGWVQFLCVSLVLLDGLVAPGTASQQTAHLSSYQLVVPQPIGNKLRRDVSNTPPNQVSYSIPVDGNEHVVHLHRNEMLLPNDFVVYSYNKDGELVTTRPPVQKHCHYQGYIEGVQDSSVAMSICNGLRGVLHFSNDSYGIEPSDSAPDQHLLYRLQDVTSQPRGCGTAHVGPAHDVINARENAQHEPEDIPHRHHTVSQHVRSKRGILPQTHYVELLLVVDNVRFIYMNKNETAIREEMVHLANYIDSIYMQLNVRVVLVGLEIWSHQNHINIEGSPGEVLSRFTQWREKDLVPRRRHDSAQLILNKAFGGTAGMAFVSTVCSRSHGGGINAFTNNNVPSFASIVSHELGHNLGMNHDDNRDCTCAVEACIMNSGATGSKNFSSCSADDFEKLTLSGAASCLLNAPQPDEAYSAPFCGNRLVDMGEECDCGTEKECEKDPCCEYKTCKLKNGAQCAYGVCCHKCQFIPGGTVCRSSTDKECDLPEYCNGSSALCQPDVFVQNGHPCQNQQAVCYNGRCQNYDQQCKDIFGQKARTAPEVCFKDVNSKGDRFGNCGYSNWGYKKCESKNALCGKLQCSNVGDGPTVFGIAPSIITTPILGTKCYGVDFKLGTDVPDPGMVADGTRCGDGKVCMNFECRSEAEVLQYDCDPQNKCHGHGLCNNNKNCHCEYGWAPPFCELTGYGGSSESGPTYNDKDTSLRDFLLVFFFLILPLLALGAFVFLRRNELLTRLGLNRRKRSQAYEGDSGTPANAVPKRVPPPRGQPPSIARANPNSAQRVQLLPDEVQTNRTGPPPHLRPPPPPLKQQPASQVPLRPAPAPPV